MAVCTAISGTHYFCPQLIAPCATAKEAQKGANNYKHINSFIQYPTTILLH